MSPQISVDLNQHQITIWIPGMQGLEPLKGDKD